MDSLKFLKEVLREDDIPFFTDEQLQFYLNKNSGDLNKTTRECLLVKAEDTTLSISGMSTADTSKYFRRMAGRYKTNNSCNLGG